MWRWFDIMGEWWNKEKEIPINDQTFQKILIFYLFECPVEVNNKKQVAARGKTLRQYGWIGGYAQTLLATMKRTGSNYLYYELCGAKDELKQKVAECEQSGLLGDKNFEMIIIKKHSEMNILNSIFYYIRNAFAHGSFSVIGSGNETTYYLESSKNEDIKAQIRLREQTLLKWIDYVTTKPNELREISNKVSKRKKITCRKKNSKVA